MMSNSKWRIVLMYVIIGFISLASWIHTGLSDTLIGVCVGLLATVVTDKIQPSHRLYPATTLAIFMAIAVIYGNDGLILGSVIGVLSAVLWLWHRSCLELIERTDFEDATLSIFALLFIAGCGLGAGLLSSSVLGFGALWTMVFAIVGLVLGIVVVIVLIVLAIAEEEHFPDYWELAYGS
jgi:hypothetical protein